MLDFFSAQQTLVFSPSLSEELQQPTSGHRQKGTGAERPGSYRELGRMSPLPLGMACPNTAWTPALQADLPKPKIPHGGRRKPWGWKQSQRICGQAPPFSRQNDKPVIPWKQRGGWELGLWCRLPGFEFRPSGY